MILHGIEYQRPTSLNMRIMADHVTYSFLAFMKSIFHFCLGCYCGGYSQNGRSNLSSCIYSQTHLLAGAQSNCNRLNDHERLSFFSQHRPPAIHHFFLLVVIAGDCAMTWAIHALQKICCIKLSLQFISPFGSNITISLEYSPMYISNFVKIQPMLTEQSAVKARKVCKDQTQVWLRLASLWSPCIAARPLPKWQECTRLGCVHSVSSDGMGIRARTVRGIVYDNKAPKKKTEHVQDKPRSHRPRINGQGKHLISEDSKATTIRSLENHS